MRFRAQNIKKDEYDERHWVWWRCWLGEWNFEVSGRLTNIGLKIGLMDYDKTFDVNLALGFVQFFLSYEGAFLREFLSQLTKRPEDIYTNGRTIGMTFNGTSLRIDLWYDPMHWSSTDPWWWSIRLNLQNFLLGKTQFSKRVIETGETKIVMPEGEYPAVYTLTEDTWKRPRWFAKKRKFVWFDIPVGIPDGDDDATFGLGEVWRGNLYAATRKVALRMLAGRRSRLDSKQYGEWREKRIAALAAGHNL